MAFGRRSNGCTAMNKEKENEKVKTKEKTSSFDTLKDLFKTKVDQPLVKKEKEKEDEKTAQKDTEKLKSKVASAEKTRSKVANIKATPELVDKLASMDLSEPDVISDEEARKRAGVPTEHGLRPPKCTPQYLPAIVNKHLVAAGMVEPEWHMVKHLPGYLVSGIRAIGRKVFAPFTKTPIENIQVIANLNDSGPNEAKEINAVAAFLRDHGKRDTEAELFFHEKIPEYGAQLKIYRALGYTFMLVKDFAGNYIYAWPESDERQISHDVKSQQIKHKYPQLEGEEKVITFKQFLLFENQSREEFIASTMGEKLVSAASNDVSIKNKVHDYHNPLEIVKALMEIDPTKGKYTQYLAKAYAKGEFRFEDENRVRNALVEFDKKKKVLQNKDINQYKTLYDLYDAVETAPELEKSKKEAKRELKREGTELVLKGDNILILNLKTPEAACYYGAGTKWCTASKNNPSIFLNYVKEGPIFLIMVKDANGNTRKFQLHYSSGQVMNEKDQPITKNEIKLLSNYPEWYEFIDMLTKNHWHPIDKK